MNNFKPVNAPSGEKEENLDCVRQLESSDDGAKLGIAYVETPGDEVEFLHDESICTSNSQESQIALKLSFTLPSSCYATMAIRELLKTSTSVSTQFECLAYVDVFSFKILEDFHTIYSVVNYFVICVSVSYYMVSYIYY